MASDTPATHDAFEVMKPYLEPTIQPLIGMKTIQILLLREALDYLVLRTEETREINEVTTPTAVSVDGSTKAGEVRRVAFLGGKQKAVESREFERLLREAWKATTGTEAQKKAQGGKECYLKDNLCLRCPRCALFGATSTESGKGDMPNIKHRIEYSTAFSLRPYEDSTEEVTFNAINDDKQTTGQALGTRHCVRAGTLFASIVTLRSATQQELVLVLKTLLAARSYGAESRTAGDLRNHVVGIIGGWEEVLTPLEFTLECDGQLGSILKEETRPTVIEEVVRKYWKYCAHPAKVTLVGATASSAADKTKPGMNASAGLTEILEAVRMKDIDKEFLGSAYADVARLRLAQGTNPSSS